MRALPIFRVTVYWPGLITREHSIMANTPDAAVYVATICKPEIGNPVPLRVLVLSGSGHVDGERRD